ncbi:hypothetical protein Aduo_010725 [Ancylostoma duodenale]
MFKLCCGIVLFATYVTFSQVEAYTHEEKETIFEGAIDIMGEKVKKQYLKLLAELKTTIEKMEDEKVKAFGRKMMRKIRKGVFATSRRRIHKIGGALSPLLLVAYTFDICTALEADLRVKVTAYTSNIMVFALYNIAGKDEIKNAVQVSCSNLMKWAGKWKTKSYVLPVGSNALGITLSYGIELKPINIA